MNRRHFLKTSIAASLGLSYTPGTLFAAPGCSPADTVLLTINLQGGPDFRHVFVPQYDSENDYSTAFWQARARAHDISPSDLTAQSNRANEYLTPQDAQYNYFGINPNCGWLKSMFDQGNLAILNNVYASTNRDHAHSTLILESANTDAAPIETEQSGWGGRLVSHCNRNIVSVSRGVNLFCNGPHLTDPLSHDNSRVISATDTRNMGLFEFDNYTQGWQWNHRGYMSRALASYYEAKAKTLPQNSPYRQIIQHEQSLRSFGRLMKTSLENLPIPEEISALYTEDAANALNNRYFAGQIRNIYDVMHTTDILDANVISAEYPGWDHHSQLLGDIEPALADVFGTGKGLDTLFTQLGTKADKLLILVYGEFGRQLAANGDNGTDHGVGNSALLIGNQVNGGVYGDLFPESEITGNRFQQEGTDIEGLTSFMQVIGQVCEKINPGSGNEIVPGWSSTDLEDGVDLNSLFT